MRKKKLEGVRKTSFYITESAAKFEEILLANMDIPRTTFHRRMIDYFLMHEIGIYPQLLAKQSAKDYVRKPILEQIYIDADRERRLAEVADRNECKLGIVLFQALMDYSVAIAPEVLGDKELKELFSGTE